MLKAQLAIYSVDWYYNGRGETIGILDVGAGSAVLGMGK